VFSYCTAGVPTFRVLSPLMGYSVWLYIWLLVLAYFNAGDILFKLLEKNDDFLTNTFNALLLNAVVVSCCLPVLLWLDCPKYVQYLNTWSELQVTCTDTSVMIRPIDTIIYIVAILPIPVVARSTTGFAATRLLGLRVRFPQCTCDTGWRLSLAERALSNYM
jgi:hypothetical protein